MEFTPIVTGTVSLKHAFLYPTSGLMGRIKLLLPDKWSEPVPLGGWLIEHDGKRFLVDTGETAGIKDLPFSRYHVTEADELPHALAKIGLTVDEIDEVFLTHLHSDHVDGAVHVTCPVHTHRVDWDFVHSLLGKAMQRFSRMPLPTGVNFHFYELTDGPFGAFAASKKLTDDGRIRAVATPGHTPGHVSILAIDDDANHVLFAGDATDSLEQLHARRPDAIGRDPQTTVESIDRILDHGRKHPTVYVPAHDPESPNRLADRTPLFPVPAESA